MRNKSELLAVGAICSLCEIRFEMDNECPALCEDCYRIVPISISSGCIKSNKKILAGSNKNYKFKEHFK